jgi:hypothetical protein
LAFGHRLSDLDGAVAGDRLWRQSLQRR